MEQSLQGTSAPFTSEDNRPPRQTPGVVGDSKLTVRGSTIFRVAFYASLAGAAALIFGWPTKKFRWLSGAYLTGVGVMGARQMFLSKNKEV